MPLSQGSASSQLLLALHSKMQHAAALLGRESTGRGLGAALTTKKGLPAFFLPDPAILFQRVD